MKRTQINKLSMFTAVAAVFVKFANSFSGKSALTAAVTELVGHITNINKLGASTVTSTKGVTANKNDSKLTLATQAHNLAGEGIAYASKAKNNELKSKLNYLFDDIYKVNDNVCIEICTAIKTALTLALPQMTGYDISQADIDTLQTMITGFEAEISNKTTAKTGHSTGILSLESEIKATNSLLRNQMDVMLRKYKTTDTDFYNSYRKARKVSDLGGSNTKPPQNPNQPPPAV